jgi:sortase (surface protein transpeptidase)
MIDRQYITLSNPIMRGRLRRNFPNQNYIKRPVKNPQPRILSDVIQRQTNPLKSRLIVPIRPVKLAEKAVNQDIIFSDKFEADADITTKKLSLNNNQHQLEVVKRSETDSRTKQKTHVKKIKNKLHLALISMAVIMLGFGVYATFVGWHTNHIVQIQATKLTQQANKASSSSTTALSTVKPSPAVVANYIVAPNLPRYLLIPKLNVDARIISVGVNAKGALETPNNVYDTAWYNESALPGEPGAMLIDGHVSSWTAHGVFYGLKTLIAGDIIEVERGDGTLFTYKVVNSQIYNSNNVNMTAAMTTAIPGEPGLNLITCTGDVIPGTSEFNERIIVFAVLE